MSPAPGNSGVHSEQATVLVVDDDHDMVSALCDILRQAGYHRAERRIRATMLWRWSSGMRPTC